MKPSLTVCSLALLLTLATPARAEFHLWSITEIFSNGDGSVQYIELSSSVSGQGLLTGENMVSTSSAGASTTFTFDTDLSGDTAGRSMLLATAGFTSLTGLDADYTIPAGFIPLSGGSLNFGEGSSVLSFSRQQLPLNGVQALNSDLQAVTAGPTNFSGFSATVAADTNATVDLATNVMNIPMLEAPGIGLANVSFSVNLDSLVFTLLDDFYLYAEGITSGNSPAQLQGGNTLYVPALEVGTELFEFNLTIIDDDPITLGNLNILSVTDQVPETEPDPEPEPEPEPDNSASISRGLTAYNNLCEDCHGANGGGNISLGAPNLITSSFNTFDLLQIQINDAMPRNSPSSCVDLGGSTCATDVANYVLNVIQGSSGVEGESIEPDGY